jgi:hypothetical protein
MRYLDSGLPPIHCGLQCGKPTPNYDSDRWTDPVRKRWLHLSDERAANHADHIGGLPEVLRTFRPQFYMDNGVPATTQVYARVLEAVAEVGSQLFEPTARRITLGDAALVVVPPPGVAAWEQNDNSIGVMIEYGSFRLSLAGDAEPRQWSWWLVHQSEPLQEVQVHKASHHGSINGDTADGLARLSPEAVIVSVGVGNSYGHPDAAALQLYAQQRAAVYRIRTVRRRYNTGSQNHGPARSLSWPYWIGENDNRVCSSSSVAHSCWQPAISHTVLGLARQASKQEWTI